MFQKIKTKLVILVSDTGTGTNLAAIIEGVNERKINGEIVGLICDSINAPALIHARKNNLRVEICQNKNELLPLLSNFSPDYIALAGWKQFISDEVILAYPNRILNLHPGLIPDNENPRKDLGVKNPDGTDALWNKGMLADKAIGNFIDQKSTYAGSSIHFLTSNFDFGPVLGRVFEKTLENDTVESLYSRLKRKENQLYVKVLGVLTKSDEQET